MKAPSWIIDLISLVLTTLVGLLINELVTDEPAPKQMRRLLILLIVFTALRIVFGGCEA